MESYAGTYQLKQVNANWYQFFVNGKEIGGYRIGKGGAYSAAKFFKL